MWKLNLSLLLERFSDDLEMKTRAQNRNSERTEIERFDWFTERIQTRVAFGWLSELGWKNFMPENFLEINRYFALTSYCKMFGQSNNAPHIRVFLGGKTKRPCFDLIICWLIKQITNTYRNHLSRSYENRSKTFLRSKKFAQLLATWVETLYKWV